MNKIIFLFALIFSLLLLLISCGNVSEATGVTDTTILTTTTQAITTIPPLYTEYTIGTLEEPAEIQAKIDRNNFNSVAVPSKVIITCKDERDVPYLVLGMGQYYDRFDMEWKGKSMPDGWVSFGGSRYIAEIAIKQNLESVPTFHCASLDELIVHVNDKKVNIKEYILIDENGEEIEYSGSGRYYAYCTVTCNGPDVMQNGRKYDSQHITYAAVFIVEITE